MYYPIDSGYAVLSIVIHVLIWALAIALIVWIIRVLSGHRHGGNGWNRPYMMDSSHRIIRERFAKGEITKEQYDVMKKDLDSSM